MGGNLVNGRWSLAIDIDKGCKAHNTVAYITYGSWALAIGAII